jgi:hypothetical protein
MIPHMNRPFFVEQSSLNLPQFDGHFKKDTIEVEGVSNEKKNTV